jgi:RNA polymerase sigma-70 factor (ECF subfamily)
LVPDASTSDEDLLRAFLEGRESAFESLMRRYEDKIFGLAFRMTGNRTDALDATQDAFISAFRRARTFRGDAAFSTWLYRIGINSCNDLLRKKGRLPTPLDSDNTTEQPADEGAQSLEESVATKLDVGTALALLPDEYKEAVVMHDLGGLPYEEIGRLTGVPVGTVKSRISRGRKRLAVLLEQREAEGTSKEGHGTSL